VETGSEQRAMPDPANVITTIAAITAPGGLITALFYYFGWTYTHTFYGYFGIDPSLIGYTTADYLAGSVDLAIVPIIFAILAVLALVGLHRLLVVPALVRGTTGPPARSNTATGDSISPATPPTAPFSRMQRFVRMLQMYAILLAAVALTGILFPGRIGMPLGIILPLSFISSSTLLGYVAHLRVKYPDALASTTVAPGTRPSWAYILTLLALGLAGGMWTLGLYGSDVGIRVATQMAAQLPYRPEVVIYSAERIALNGPGIIVAEITQPGN
jgi:hypothetical protein